MRKLSKAISEISAGHYVAAISGGVDSMVLLHLLAKAPHLTIAVAHMNHGIRADSAADYTLVQQTAALYGLPFYGAQIALGKSASEATARTVRYDFLYAVQKRTGSAGIITAHHQDDLIETIILQVRRGTYRQGLSPLSNTCVTRPFLSSTKAEIIEYAQAHSITWHEDSTNASALYARNKLRKQMQQNKSHGTSVARQKLLATHRVMQAQNAAINRELLALDSWLRTDLAIDRQKFALLPHIVARDYVAFFLKGQGIQYDSRYLEQLVVALKVQKPQSRVSVGVGGFVEITQKTAQLLVQ